MADLKAYTPESDTITVTLPIENDDGSPMTIEVYAPYSKEYKSLVHKQANERIKKMNNKKKQYPSVEELEASQLDLYVGITKSWNITYDGEQPKFSEVKAREIYTEVFWIKDKIEEALQDSADFMNF